MVEIAKLRLRLLYGVQFSGVGVPSLDKVFFRCVVFSDVLKTRVAFHVDLAVCVRVAVAAPLEA